MFDFIRTHQRLMQFLLLLFILPSFAFFGLEGYTRFSEDANVVAKVGGQTITQQELDAAHRQQMDRLRQMFGDQFDAKMFDTPEARKDVLDGLIAQRALMAEVKRNNIVVSDQVLQQTILDIPGLKTPDGKFDSERYKSLLAAQGMTPAIFEERVRQDLAMQQLTNAVQNTAIAPKFVATRLSEINEQEREVQEVLFRESDYVPQVKVTDDMLKNYYEKNGEQFEIPEQVKAEYVVLDSDTVASQISVSDADIKSYYDQNAQRYATPEQRRASHILIPANKNASESEKAAAKAKAEQLLAQVRKNPGEFAKLAKENSQDPGSAERGGDLGFFGRGMMVKPFEDAAFALKKGEIANLVQSDFGYHIIQVTDVKPASQKSLDEVKNEISAEIKKQLASKKFTELAESFSNMLYEQPDSLKPVADKLNLKIAVADNITGKGNPALPPNAPFNHPKFVQALFSEDVLKNKNNTEAIEVEKNTLIAGRVAEFKPKSKKPFEEVKAAIRERVVQVEADVLARKAGEAKLAELKTKPDAAGFSAPKTVSRATNPGLSSQAFMAIMKADASSLPAFVGVDLPTQGYAIYRINKVAQPATADAERRKAQQSQIADALAQQETFAYIESLKNKAKVEIVKPIGAPAAPEAAE
jgi:peptidyl-prolyl cis-trans isomerase D